MPLNLPQFYESKYYKDPQKKLFDISGKLMSGDIPEWLRPIMEAGGQPFQDMIRQMETGVQRNVLEAGAKMGTRGGVMQDIIAKTTAEATVPLRYQDYVSAMGGRERLFGRGVSGMEGVRGAGLQEMGQRNVYEMDKAKSEYQAEQAEREREEAEELRKSQFLSSIISTGIGAAGSLYGVSQYSKLLKTLTGGGDIGKSKVYDPTAGSHGKGVWSKGWSPTSKW